ncbi:kinase-like domain-containing protein [Mycena galericulata]|nr:kinase-like domain-containing protein [Mycena galericulata]
MKSTSEEQTSTDPYLCGNLNLCEFLSFYAPDIVGRPLSVRIFDFGGAYVVDGSAPPRPVTPRSYAAPEIVFAQVALNKEDPPWDQRSDIWSLGVAFHDLVGAGGLFSAQLLDNTELPHFMVYFCGEVPGAWRDHIDSRPWPMGFAPEMTEGFWDGKKECFARLGVEDPPGLVRLMLRMLVLDPEKRPSAQELLDDPYFFSSDGGIPHGKDADLQTNQPNLPTLVRLKPRPLWILNMFKTWSAAGSMGFDK